MRMEESGSDLRLSAAVKGKIVRGIGGFYYVDTEPGGIYACRARGIFRKDGKKPLVGDDVEISIVHEKDREGSLDRILPRRSALIRPAVANVDQALVIFAAAMPEPNLNLLDRFLISMRQQQIPVVICFNKTDLVSEARVRELTQAYTQSGCLVFGMSVLKKTGLEQIKTLLQGKTTVVAGPSGVGKSSLTNYLKPDAAMEVGELSTRISRGRQTTRHTQLERIAPRTYFLDTPGFSSLYVSGIDETQLRDFYPEFTSRAGRCFYQDCMHLSEPDCAVRQALENGEIASVRYENYRQIYEELKNRRKY